MESKKKSGSIRRRLITVFILSSSVIFFANVVMYYNINKSIGTIDQVYKSNVELNQLYAKLSIVQDNVYEFLNTRSSESLENYYRSDQEYRKLINALDGKITDNDMLLMQKNIKNMSETYLQIIDETVDAKRGRNIEKYKARYEEATQMQKSTMSY